jgi:hypothetical protein
MVFEPIATMTSIQIGSGIGLISMGKKMRNGMRSGVGRSGGRRKWRRSGRHVACMNGGRKNRKENPRKQKRTRRREGYER